MKSTFNLMYLSFPILNSVKSEFAVSIFFSAAKTVGKNVETRIRAIRRVNVIFLKLFILLFPLFTKD